LKIENNPLISVIFITYKRIDLLKKTYESFLSTTNYPIEKLELILCDDGSSEDIQAEMKKIRFDKYLLVKKNEGMASNVNKGLKAASGKYILQLQDDWVCNGPGDYLNLGIKALEEFPDVGIIRYRLGTDYLHHSKKFNGGLNNICILERDQKDKKKKVNHMKSTFLYSDTPHLKRSILHEVIGFYKSYKNIAKTEIDFCLRFNKNQKYNAAYIHGYEEVFQHIGENFSLREQSTLSKIKVKIKSSFNF
jgi:glycosyltransferase involved in cell wall biosynthesis